MSTLPLSPRATGEGSLGTSSRKWGKVYTNELHADNIGTAAESDATDFAPAAHVGSGGAAHSLASGADDGFMSKEDFTKLGTVEENANDYVHPTSEGYKHVPAITETDVDKTLVAGVGGPYWASSSGGISEGAVMIRILSQKGGF